MADVTAKFSLNDDNNLNPRFNLSEEDNIDATFIINASGTTWGSISGTLSNQTDLQAALDLKADKSELDADIAEVNASISDLETIVNNNYTTLDNKIDSVESDLSGDISALSTTVQNNYATLDGKIDDTESALSGQITALSDTVNINNQNINNRVDTVEETISNLTDTVSDNYIELDARISDNADDILVINNTISGYGNIVTHNVNEFATAAQGALADSALQPGDNISELVNNVGYITSASLPTLEDLTTQAQLDAINSGATATNIGQITTNENDIADIRDLIPSQATSSNQLADKAFVNSSIATNTAYFIGTFNSVAELEAYSGPLTNNDYAFVATTDTAGNTLYDRYKYNADTQQWIFEYELNNSSFTAAQWASINSGITSGDVSLIQSALQPNDNISELVNDAGYLQNNAEESSSLAVGDDITTNRGRYSVLLGNSTEGQSGTVALGYNASGTSNSIAIGYNSSASSTGSTAIGSASSVTAKYAIQLGYGTNSTANSLSVGFYNSYTTHYNWELLDGTTGLIPNARISSDIARTNQIPTVNNGTLDIQVNGTSIGTFTANQAGNSTANIVVPNSATWGNITGTLSDQTDLQDALDDKQDVISDLSTIRSGAALGATALQPNDNITELTNNAGYISGITGAMVTTALGYTPLSNATKYGSSLSYSSNVLQLLDQDGNALGGSVTIQSSPDIDNKSITTNSSDELQTVGVIDQNNTTNAIKTWTGTKAQYDAIASKDANTRYDVTDDISNNNSIVVDLNGKADVDLTNCTVPYVVSRITNDQGIVVETWSDGYCVQSGNSSGTYQTITLPQPYIDDSYSLQTTIMTDSTASASNWSIGFFGAVKLSTSQIKIGYTGCWETKGYIR